MVRLRKRARRREVEFYGVDVKIGRKEKALIEKILAGDHGALEEAKEYASSKPHEFVEALLAHATEKMDPQEEKDVKKLKEILTKLYGEKWEEYVPAFVAFEVDPSEAETLEDKELVSRYFEAIQKATESSWVNKVLSSIVDSGNLPPQLLKVAPSIIGHPGDEKGKELAEKVYKTVLDGLKKLKKKEYPGGPATPFIGPAFWSALTGYLHEGGHEYATMITGALALLSTIGAIRRYRKFRDLEKLEKYTKVSYMVHKLLSE